VELLRDPDAELVAACRAPQSDAFEAAFGELFLRYRERVHAIAYRVTGNAIDALDVTQESFALLFRKLESFRGGSLFSTWLFRIVVNCAIDHRRRRDAHTTSVLSGREHLPDPADMAPGPRDAAAVRELGADVQRAMAELSPKLRAILALRYLEDMSYEELATALDLSLGTVKSRLARAHLALETVVRSRFPQLHIDLQTSTSIEGVG
jgi:RNA polymerase sigma-70 factor, ECF subfamily